MYCTTIHTMLTTLEQKYLTACLKGDADTVVYMINKENKKIKNNKFINKCLKSCCKGGNIDVFKIIMQYVDALNNCCAVINIAMVDSCELGRLDFFMMYCCKIQYGKLWLSLCLRMACKSGNMDLVKYIIEIIDAKPSIDRNYDWNRYLINACYGGNVEIIDLCIEKGADCWNQCAVTACESKNSNSLDIYKFMVEKGTNTELMFCSCLREACKIGNVEIAKLLIGNINFLALGADKLDKCFEKACYGGNIEIIELMINKGSDNWNKGMCGACGGGHNNIIELMIGKGSNNWDEGMVAAFCNGHIDIAKYMISKGITNFNACLKWACLYGETELVKLSIENGGDDWDAGLFNACKGTHVELVSLMIKHGATNFNESLIANTKDDADISNILISKGANKFSRFWNTNNFKLYCLYRKYKKIRPEFKGPIYTLVVNKYPPYVLLYSSKASKSYNCIKRLPIELFQLLDKY